MAKQKSMPETFMRHIWKDASNFLQTPLILEDGSSLKVIEYGKENLHRGGPDFLDAKISIDNLAISGDVELHIEAKNWDEHGHTHDQKYSSVILHVVLEPDEVVNSAGPKVPTLILRENFAFSKPELWKAIFERVYDRSPELPCFPHNLQLSIHFKHKVLERFGEARLDKLIGRFLKYEDIPERTYQLTMDALGYSQNRKPFGEIARILNTEIIQTVCANANNRRLAIEAVLFKIAGLLSTPSASFDPEANEYIINLNAELEVVTQYLGSLETIAKSDWAFFRIRPNNSPYRRLALAAILADKYFGVTNFDFTSPFFLEGPSIPLGSSPFWESRTSFGAKLPAPENLLGEERKSAICLNVIMPARIAGLTRETTGTKPKLAQLRKDWGSERSEASAQYLKVIEQELLESESVKTVRSEQGALMLKRNFCEELRCSECPVGSRLIETGWNGPGR